MPLLRNRTFQLLCLAWLGFIITINSSDCISYQTYSYSVCPRLNGFYQHNERASIFHLKGNDCCFQLETQLGETSEHCFPSLQRFGSKTASWLPGIAILLSVVTGLVLVMLIGFEIDRLYRIECNDMAGALVILLAWAIVTFGLMYCVNGQLDQIHCILP
jgi:cytochrome b subunit of formate dehydrogenase